MITKADTQYLTHDELSDMLVDLVNEMESTGNKYREKFDDDDDMTYVISAMSCVLLTRYNRIKYLLARKKSISCADAEN